MMKTIQKPHERQFKSTQFFPTAKFQKTLTKSNLVAVSARSWCVIVDEILERNTQIH